MSEHTPFETALFAYLYGQNSVNWPGTHAKAISVLVAREVAAAKAEALREAADDCAAALVNEVGSGHTSTYSVRRWLHDRADALDPDTHDLDEREGT